MKDMGGESRPLSSALMPSILFMLRSLSKGSITLLSRVVALADSSEIFFFLGDLMKLFWWGFRSMISLMIGSISLMGAFGDPSSSLPLGLRLSMSLPSWRLRVATVA